MQSPQKNQGGGSSSDSSSRDYGVWEGHRQACEVVLLPPMSYAPCLHCRAVGQVWSSRNPRPESPGA